VIQEGPFLQGEKGEWSSRAPRKEGMKKIKKLPQSSPTSSLEIGASGM
jgi:hypothetical protein